MPTTIRFTAPDTRAESVWSSVHALLTNPDFTVIVGLVAIALAASIILVVFVPIPEDMAAQLIQAP